MKKVAVIGSGYAGLTCATLLAKKGYKVDLFEKHSALGGYGDGFVKKGFTFHTSTYRLPAITYSLLEQVLDIKYTDFLHYNTLYHFLDRKVLLDDNLFTVLVREFPQYSENMHQFIAKVTSILEILNEIEASGGNILTISASKLKDYVAFSKLEIREVLADYFENNQQFADMFCALFDLSLDMSATTILVTIYAIKTSAENTMVFGGGKRIIEDLEKTLLNFDGVIHRREEVLSTKIIDEKLVEINTSKGVKHANFDFVVWANDYNNFYRLDNEQYRNVKTRDDFEPSSSSFAVWLGLDQTFESLNLKEPYHSVYIGNRNFYSKVAKKTIPIETDYLMVSFLYSKDPYSTPDNKSQVCAGAAMNFDFMKECKEKGIYKEVKNEITEMFLSVLKENFEIDEENIICKTAATPLTYERYTHNRKGSMYGFEKKEDFVISSKRHGTTNPNIKNVFFCSHWTSVVGGTYGAMKEGVTAANDILQLDNMDTYQYQE